MGAAEVFLRYAADFEKCFADDDWSRIEPHFAPDAIYRVDARGFGCEIQGPAAIAAGMKKSLDGFDRRFERREIDVREGPSVEGDELRVAWTVTYTTGDHPPFALRGASTARVAGDRIVLLVDAFDDGMVDEMDRWQQATGFHFDPSYV